MERTEAEEVLSGPLEGDMLADNLDDVGGIGYLGNCTVVYHPSANSPFRPKDVDQDWPGLFGRSERLCGPYKG